MVGVGPTRGSLNFIDYGAANTCSLVTNPVSERAADSWFYVESNLITFPIIKAKS